MTALPLNSILLIDDDKINNYLNSRLIKKSNICVNLEIAQNGSEGLTLIQQKITTKAQLPNLILLDINMPIMDGFEFMNSFKELNCDDVKIVLLTTSSNPDDIRKFNQSLACGYINKPLTEDKLKNIIQECF